MLRLKHFIQLKQAERELGALAENQKELENQLVEAREINSKVVAYEMDVRQKLTELSNILEAATSMGVAEETEDATHAQPLEGGIGGPELDCSEVSLQGLSICPQIMADAGMRARLSFGALSRDKLMLSARSLPMLPQREESLLGLLDRYVEFVGSLPLANPAQGRISSGYGFRSSPFNGHLSLHQGVDISLSRGSNIRCTAEGIVKEVQSNPTYGLMVDVEHSDRIVTRYAHMSKILVKEGQKVKVGDVIGLAGSTGRSTGPHLHYEVRVDGNPKNPKNFLGLASGIKELL